MQIVRISAQTIVYWGTGKNRYQMEVPDRIKVPDDFQLTSSRKGFKRYRLVAHAR